MADTCGVLLCDFEWRGNTKHKRGAKDPPLLTLAKSKVIDLVVCFHLLANLVYHSDTAIDAQLM